MRRSKILSFLIVVAAVTGACGGGSDHSESHGGNTTDASAAGPPRTVDVVMRDIAFEPAAVTVKAGETVKFVFRNEGQIPHDAFLGDDAAQAAHEKEMRESEGGHHGDEGHAVTVQPGQTGSFTYTFDRDAALLIGCHQPGHWQAGMKLTLARA